MKTDVSQHEPTKVVAHHPQNTPQTPALSTDGSGNEGSTNPVSNPGAPQIAATMLKAHVTSALQQATRLASGLIKSATQPSAIPGQRTADTAATVTPTDGVAAAAADVLSEPQSETVAWQAIIDALPSAAVALDASGVVQYHNTPAAELYPKIKIGQPISHVSRNPEFMGAVERIWQASEPISVELVERVPVERRFFATLTRIAPRANAARLPHALITFRDTSEQDKLIQMRADFIANASHELRTPLSSLIGGIETLQGPARDDPAARERFLGRMATQAMRMTRLIDDLLSLSRAEMRVHLPPRGIVELNETCAFVIQTLEPLAEASGITVKFKRLPAPALIRGERDEIVQALQNLFQNAIKYGHDGGNVEVHLTLEGGHGQARERLIVAVIDDGCGIGPEHLPRLTERFYRANVSSSREKGGTGLGLAIVKHIVNRHRGELRIQSTLGSGSTFTISFDALTADRGTPPDATEKNRANAMLNAVTKQLQR